MAVEMVSNPDLLQPLIFADDVSEISPSPSKDGNMPFTTEDESLYNSGAFSDDDSDGLLSVEDVGRLMDSISSAPPVIEQPSGTFHPPPANTLVAISNIPSDSPGIQCPNCRQLDRLIHLQPEYFPYRGNKPAHAKRQLARPKGPYSLIWFCPSCHGRWSRASDQCKPSQGTCIGCSVKGHENELCEWRLTMLFSAVKNGSKRQKMNAGKFPLLICSKCRDAKTLNKNRSIKGAVGVACRHCGAPFARYYSTSKTAKKEAECPAELRCGMWHSFPAAVGPSAAASIQSDPHLAYKRAHMQVRERFRLQYGDVAFPKLNANVMTLSQMYRRSSDDLDRCARVGLSLHNSSAVLLHDGGSSGSRFNVHDASSRAIARGTVLLEVRGDGQLTRFNAFCLDHSAGLLLSVVHPFDGLGAVEAVVVWTYNSQQLCRAPTFIASVLEPRSRSVLVADTKGTSGMDLLLLKISHKYDEDGDGWSGDPVQPEDIAEAKLAALCLSERGVKQGNRIRLMGYYPEIDHDHTQMPELKEFGIQSRHGSEVSLDAKCPVPEGLSGSPGVNERGEVAFILTSRPPDQFLAPQGQQTEASGLETMAPNLTKYYGRCLAAEEVRDFVNDVLRENKTGLSIATLYKQHKGAREPWGKRLQFIKVMKCIIPFAVLVFLLGLVLGILEIWTYPSKGQDTHYPVRIPLCGNHAFAPVDTPCICDPQDYVVCEISQYCYGRGCYFEPLSCGWVRSGTCSDMDFLSCADGVQAFQCVALAAGVSPSYCEGRCSGNATKPCVGKAETTHLTLTNIPEDEVWESVALGPRQSKCPFVYECPRKGNPDERLCCGTADTEEQLTLNAINPSLIGLPRIIDMLVQDAGAVYYLWIRSVTRSSFRRDGPIYRATCDFTVPRCDPNRFLVMPIPSSWLVHRIRTAGGYVYAMIEKNNVQSNSMFFVDLTDNNQLFGLPQYEAKGVKSVVFDPRLFVTTYSWDFAVAPSGRSNLRFYIFRRAILDDPVSLWMYDLLIPNKTFVRYKKSEIHLQDISVFSRARGRRNENYFMGFKLCVVDYDRILYISNDIRVREYDVSTGVDRVLRHLGHANLNQNMDVICGSFRHQKNDVAVVIPPNMYNKTINMKSLRCTTNISVL